MYGTGANKTITGLYEVCGGRYLLTIVSAGKILTCMPRAMTRRTKKKRAFSPVFFLRFDDTDYSRTHFPYYDIT